MENFCYLCGGIGRKLLTSSNRWICGEYPSQCPAVRKKSSESLKKVWTPEKRKERSDLYKKVGWLGPNAAWAKGRTAEIDNRIRTSSNIENIENVLKVYKQEDIKNKWGIRTKIYLIKKFVITHNLLQYDKCNKCNISEWFGEKLLLELHHINYDKWDNRLENLEFLCPNCHSINGKYMKSKNEVFDGE